MRKYTILYLHILLFALSACSPSQADLSTQTAVAVTSIAASWTATPTLTLTPIPTLTPTPTKTPLPTATLIGGGQGKVIFLRDDANAEDWDIFSMNPNGTGMQQLTFLDGAIFDPIWSPAGDKIAFSYKETSNAFSQLYVMNPDGSGITKISTDNQKNYYHPDWSPDGQNIVFYSEIEHTSSGRLQLAIFVMNVDGTDEIQLTSDDPEPGESLAIAMEPDWSPDGSKIAFVSVKKGRPEIFVMNADGTERKPLTSFRSGTFPGGINGPKWSPDGKYIVFQSQKGGKKEWEIYLMNSDGTNVVQLTDNDTWDMRPKFSPDGTKISWDSCCFNLSVMDLDGSNVVKLSSDFGWAYEWRP